MTVRLRLAAVVLSLALPALLLASWSLGSEAHGITAPPDVPNQVGPWASTLEQQLEPDVLAIIEPDAHLVRLYEAPGRTPIWLYVGFYAGRANSGKGAHNPETCYPAQGWEVETAGTAKLALGDGEEFRAHALVFRKMGAGETVLYWFQPAQRWPRSASSEELLRVADALAGRPQYAFVRFSAPTTADAESDIVEFAAAIAPAIRDAVDDIGGSESQSMLP